MPKVYVVGGAPAYLDMFLQMGWEVVTLEEDADLIQFTGGPDVNPSLYDHPRHPTTRCNRIRDAYEVDVFNRWRGEKPMAGICRGGQLLNVLCGGTLWQNVGGHSIGGTHDAIDMRTGEEIPVSSTHHQMMQRGPNSTIIGTAAVSGFREGFKQVGGQYVPVLDRDVYVDLEALAYISDKVLCFQPHPEHFDSDHPCQVWYFKLIAELLEGV